MALKSPEDFTFKGLVAPDAIARLEQHAVQVFKDQKSAHIILALHASYARQKAGDEPLVQRWLEVTVTVDKKQAQRANDPVGPDGTQRITLYCPDVVRMWGGKPAAEEALFTDAQWAAEDPNVYAQAYLLLTLLPILDGWKGI